MDAYLLHPLQCRGKGKDGVLDGHGPLSIQSDGGGPELGKFLSDVLDLACGNGHGAFLLMVGRGCPALSFAFGGQAARLPTGLRSKP